MSSRDHSVDRPPPGLTPVREPTESIHLDEAEADSASAGTGGESESDSLARGTGLPPEDQTKVGSPAARNRTGPRTPVSGDRERGVATRTGERARRATTKPPPVPDREGPSERIGAQLGSYRIMEVLGKGGMGYVYRAEHVKLGRAVALKLLRSDYAKRRDAVARFFQEARTVNRIRHRNIVDVTDFVELPDGTTFIIMELLDGFSLGKWARRGFDVPRALAVLIQICDGLAAAHAVGVIHRDLKPDNVIIVPTSDGAEMIKLLDFGVAKLVNRDDEDVGLETAAGSVIGTPAYMSPEQAGGLPVDSRSDIYSVGAIMYELFCGQPMFRGRSFGEYVRKHLGEMPPRPRTTVGGAEMDERLELAILRATEKDPNRRFATIAELRDTLLHLLGVIETHPPGQPLFTADLMPPGSGPVTGARPVLMGSLPTPLPMSSPALGTPGSAVSALPGAPPPVNLTGIAEVAGSSTVAPPPPPLMTSPMTSVSSVSQLASGNYHTSHRTRPMPWWVWFVGGAVAVGLGIGGAAWFAAREPARTVRAAAPTPTGLPAPSQPTRRVVRIRFSSMPSAAGVFALGSSTELCRTPCTLDVDLGDGGAVDRREYVIRRDGHDDAPVAVPIGSDDSIELEPVVLAPIEVVEPPAPPTTPPPAVASDPSAGLRAGKQIAKTRGHGKKPPPRPPARPPEKPVADKPPVKPPEKPPEKPVEPPKTKIDRTDTIDPFGGK